MKKIVFRCALALLALLLLAVGLAFVFVDPLVRAAVESGGSWATGVETKLASADVGLVSGDLKLRGLSVANPPGFRPEPFVELKSAHSAFENGSLVADEIHVKDLAIDGLVLNLERTSAGTNFGVILDHLGRMSSPDAQTPPAPAGKNRTIVVDHIALTHIHANLHLAGVPVGSGAYSVEVPPLEIKDFRTDGSTAAIVGKLLKQVVQSALDGALKAGTGVFPADLVHDLEGQLKSGSLKEVNGTLKQAGKAVEDMFKKKK